MAALKIACAKLGLVIIDGIQSSRLTPGLVEILSRGDGAPFDSHVSIERIEPRAEFTTKQIANAITALGLAHGTVVAATPLEIWTQLIAEQGTRAVTGTKLNITDAVTFPMAINAVKGQDAVITYGVAMAKSTGVAPYGVTDAQTVPTTALLDAVYRLGDVTINTSMSPVKSINIDFGYQARFQHGEGIWPILCYIEQSQPLITIETELPTALSTLTVSGSDDIIGFTLAKRAQGGGLAGSGDLVFATHVQLVMPDGFSGGLDDLVVTSIRCRPVFDGTNNPITLTA